MLTYTIISAMIISTKETKETTNPVAKPGEWRKKAMNKYTKYLSWAVFTMIDRSTQDDRKSKVSVSGSFNCPSNAEEFIKTLPAGHKWYILDFDRLERFEEFYNFVQDINEEYGERAIFHINDGGFSEFFRGLPQVAYINYLER